MLGEDFGIIFIGNKPFRNLSVVQWHEIISRIRYPKKIALLDDPDRLFLESLVALGLPANIIPIREKLDLWSFFALSRRSKFFVGVDGGGFNMGQTPTNVFGIFMITSNHVMWRPYSDRPYVETVRGGYRYDTSVTSAGLLKAVFTPNDPTKIYYDVFQVSPNPILTGINIPQTVKCIQDFIDHLPTV